MKRFLLGLGLALGLSFSASAQERALVVSACGTLPDTYVAGQVRYLTQDTLGNQCSLLSAASPSSIMGNVAAAVADSGNPVKIGGVFNTTPPTYTTGQRGDAQLSARGSLNVEIVRAATAANVTATSSDAFSTANAGLTTQGTNYIFNGTTWDRVRVGPYQLAQTPIIGVGTGTTGAVTGTLAGVASKTTYICGFDISATGGTAALGPITVTGLSGGTFTYQLFSTATGVQLQKTFNPCYPASAVNTAIVVTTTANGTATAVDVNAQGFQQ